jgi:ATP/maltotriose-dependent transcriptional regulator MalT
MAENDNKSTTVPTQNQAAPDPLEGFTAEDLAQILRDENAAGSEKAAARKRLSEISAQAAKDYVADLKKRDDLDAKEKKILELYNKGVQNFEIARQVFDGMVNSDTVGRVVLTIRKQHAEDFDEIEDIDSTRGYVGVSGGTSGKVI